MHQATCVQRRQRGGEATQESARVAPVDGAAACAGPRGREALHPLDSPRGPCAVVPIAFVRRVGVKAGDTLLLDTVQGRTEFSVHGTLEPRGPATVYGGALLVMDVYAAQLAFDRGRRFDRIDIIAQPDADVPALGRRIERALGGKVAVTSPAQRSAQAERLRLSAHGRADRATSMLASALSSSAIRGCLRRNAALAASLARRKADGSFRIARRCCSMSQLKWRASQPTRQPKEGHDFFSGIGELQHPGVRWWSRAGKAACASASAPRSHAIRRRAQATPRSPSRPGGLPCPDSQRSIHVSDATRPSDVPYTWLPSPPPIVVNTPRAASPRFQSSSRRASQPRSALSHSPRSV